MYIICNWQQDWIYLSYYSIQSLLLSNKSEIKWWKKLIIKIWWDKKIIWCLYYKRKKEFHPSTIHLTPHESIELVVFTLWSKDRTKSSLMIMMAYLLCCFVVLNYIWGIKMKSESNYDMIMTTFTWYVLFRKFYRHSTVKIM